MPSHPAFLSLAFASAFLYILLHSKVLFLCSRVPNFLCVSVSGPSKEICVTLLKLKRVQYMEPVLCKFSAFCEFHECHEIREFHECREYFCHECREYFCRECREYGQCHGCCNCPQERETSFPTFSHSSFLKKMCMPMFQKCQESGNVKSGITSISALFSVSTCLCMC